MEDLHEHKCLNCAAQLKKYSDACEYCGTPCTSPELESLKKFIAESEEELRIMEEQIKRGENKLL